MIQYELLVWRAVSEFSNLKSCHYLRNIDFWVVS